MTNTIGYENLAERRWQATAIMMYKICNNLIDIPVSLFTLVAYYRHRSQACVLVPYCRKGDFKNSFITSETKLWKGLLTEDRSIGSLEAFNNQTKQGKLKGLNNFTTRNNDCQ